MKSIRVDRGTITMTPRGYYLAYIYDSGTRYRKVFRTFVAAEQWLKAMSERAAPPPLTNCEYQDAQYALRELPQGTTLIDAVRFYNRNYIPSSDATKISRALERFLKNKEISSARATIVKYKSIVTRFIQLHGDMMLSSYTHEHVNEMIANCTPAYRNNILRHLSSFFSWCVKNKHCGSNPCDGVAKAKKVQAPLGILSVSEVEYLLHYAEVEMPHIVPYLAVGLFAGVRPQEMLRMTADNIRNGYIVLDASITKTADARTIPIRDNLAKWLSRYSWQVPSDRQIKKCRAKTKGQVNWSHDCLRHSFATYAYELTKDANLVASEMGHHGTKVFFTHYRALATPGSGVKFFSIKPKRKDSIHTPMQIESTTTISSN